MYDLNKDKYIDECGIIGVFLKEEKDLYSLIKSCLISIQHRGQESAGICIYKDKKFIYDKGLGICEKALNNTFCEESNIGIGHVRYSTAGSSSFDSAQPILFNGKKINIAIAHNGHIINYLSLKNRLIIEKYDFKSDTDSEIIAALIDFYWDGNIINSIKKVMNELCGAYCVNILFGDKLITFRDPNGFRPLWLGKINDGYLISSEVCTYESNNGDIIREINPGEIIIIDREGMKEYNQDSLNKMSVCAMEYIYFSNYKNIINGIKCETIRKKIVEKLVVKNIEINNPLVIGIPDTGILFAKYFSEVSGYEYFGYNNLDNYIERSFIMPTKEQRMKNAEYKLTFINEKVKNRNIILIDDSIVRGTTCINAVKKLKKLGAKSIHIFVGSPIIKYPCFMGLDIPTTIELLGYNRSIDEIKNYLKCDSINYLSINELIECLGNNACLACFNGDYPVRSINEKD